MMSMLNLILADIIFTFLKLSAQFLDFFLELLEQGILGVLVNAGFVSNVLSTTSVTQRVQSFVVIVTGWTDIGALQV